jgi:GTP-binding protein HflX
VGFISDLPTHLVAAFRATLEEVVEADLVIHLRDISDPDTAAQASDVEQILKDLGVDTADPNHIIEVWNKIDLLDAAAGERMIADGGGNHAPIAISAQTGQGVDRLLSQIEQRLAGSVVSVDVNLMPAQLGLVDWIYRNGEITARKDNDDGSVSLTVLTTGAIRDEIVARVAAR